MADDSANTNQYTMAAAELDALLDAAVDAMVVIDERGVILMFNAAAERMFECREADVLGENVTVLMAEPHRSSHGDYMRHYLDTGEARVIGLGREVQGQRTSGELFPVALSVGEAAGTHGRRFVGILRDLSEQRAAEQRARSLEARLSHVARFNLMGEMAAGIAHEINQPLSAIAMYAQAARRFTQQEPADLGKLSDVCRRIDEQARRAGQVIDNLRKFLRKQEVTTQSLDGNRVIGDVLNLIEADANAEGIPVSTRYAEGLPEVRANAVQLQQVLLNLTRNSVDAMRDGLRKELGIVVATEDNGRGGVRISVTDHGASVSR
jgi:two-component system sensor kinase FixL